MLGKIHLKAALIGAGTAVLLGIAPAGAGEIDDLKAEIEALQKRLGKIEAAQKEAKEKAVPRMGLARERLSSAASGPVSEHS